MDLIEGESPGARPLSTNLAPEYYYSALVAEIVRCKALSDDEIASAARAASEAVAHLADAPDERTDPDSESAKTRADMLSLLDLAVALDPGASQSVTDLRSLLAAGIPVSLYTNFDEIFAALRRAAAGAQLEELAALPRLELLTRLNHGHYIPFTGGAPLAFEQSIGRNLEAAINDAEALHGQRAPSDETLMKFRKAIILLADMSAPGARLETQAVPNAQLKDSIARHYSPVTLLGHPEDPEMTEWNTIVARLKSPAVASYLLAWIRDAGGPGMHIALDQKECAGRNSRNCYLALQSVGLTFEDLGMLVTDVSARATQGLGIAVSWQGVPGAVLFPGFLAANLVRRLRELLSAGDQDLTVVPFLSWASPRQVDMLAEPAACEVATLLGELGATSTSTLRHLKLFGFAAR